MNKLMMIATMSAMAASSSWAADGSASAMDIAVAQQACGENGTIISARFLDDGRVGVTCESAAVAAASSSAPGLFAGAGTTSALVAGGFALAVAAAAAGGSSSTSGTQ